MSLQPYASPKLLALASETSEYLTEVEILNVLLQLGLYSHTSIICHEKSTLCVATGIQT